MVYFVGPLREGLASLLSTCFTAALVLGIGAPYMPGLLPATVIAWAERRRTMIIALGFLMNLVATNLRQSGAFEVYLDDTRIHSKLETGTVPTAAALARQILERIAAAQQ
ncbi:hypothetical protein DQ04_02531030 [Trypanosoma grayi]|uniref:hypothetical protein n=1 Tax=Trypanosoma grayi TaxID=71804 RepID=UPI0004F4BB98|nr:hypothetical protein DQ04_02531030 [Trypanosoma grayi]KEG11527.1 hypothetical protein DQ04_02531030 [Trypanosoma grayi]